MKTKAINGIQLLVLMTGLVVAASIFAQSLAASEIRIQRYDSDGNVVRTDRATGESDEADTTDDGDDQDHGIEPDSILVTGPSHVIKNTARSLGLRIIEIRTLSGIDLTIAEFEVPRGKSAEDVLAEIKRYAPDLTSDFNHRFVEAIGSTSNARSFMGWPRSTKQCGSNSVIGMIDGSVDKSHPAFKGSNLVTRSFIGNRHNPGSHDHGTAVASILVGNPDWGGLLPGAKLYAANIFYEKQNGKRAASARALSKAINWLVEEKIKVLNLSIAGPDNAVVKKVVQAAAHHGVVMIAAAGNGGSKAKPAYPAAYEETIAVTAVNHDAEIYSAANHGSYIDFAMPGVKVWTAIPGGGAYQNGTSFAAPFITALAAAEIANGASAVPGEFRKLMIPNAVDLGAPGKDTTFGYGFIKQPPRCFAGR